MKKIHLGGLDYLRFCAASLVMLFHLAVMASKPVGPNFGIPDMPEFPELDMFSVGWVGVEIFFVLSGLVIAQSAEGRSAYRFLRGRASRLLPAAWICATIGLVVVLTFRMPIFGPVFSTYVKTLILYPNGPWISNVYWSLIVEVTFYSAVFGLLMAGAIRHIDRLAALLVFLSSVYILGIVIFGWPHLKSYFLVQHGCFFGLGILIWLNSVRGYSLGRTALMSFALIVCLIEICEMGNGKLVGYYFWLAPTVWLVAVVAMIAATIFPFEGGPILRTIGLMTYPLYLVHEKIGASVLRLNPQTGRWLALVLAIGAALLTSLFVLKLERIIRPLLEECLDVVISFLPGANGAGKCPPIKVALK